MRIGQYSPALLPKWVVKPSLHFGTGTSGLAQQLRDEEEPKPTKQSNSLTRKVGRLWSATRFFVPILAGAALASVVPSPKLRDWVENRALYQPPAASPLSALRSKALQESMKDVFFPSSDGLRLHGWYKAPEPNKPAIIYSYDNASRLSDAEPLLKALAIQGFGVLAYDYRGYGESEGQPSEAGFSADLESAGKFLESRNIPAKDQVLVGKCLGSSVTIDVASRHPDKYRGVLVMSVPTTMPEMLTSIKAKFYIPKWLLGMEDKIEQRFDNVKKIGLIRSPLVIVQGEKDPLTPFEMAKTLHEKAPGSVLIPVPKGKHYLLKLASTQIADAIAKYMDNSTPEKA